MAIILTIIFAPLLLSIAYLVWGVIGMLLGAALGNTFVAVRAAYRKVFPEGVFPLNI
jgi:hypothetical protein